MPNNISKKTSNVIDILSKKPVIKNYNLELIRLAQETDGVVMLYANDANPGKLFSLKIMGWGLQSNGEVVGLVPWLNEVVTCPELSDPLNGHWEGYFNQTTGDVFYVAPDHKAVELRAAQQYYQALPEASNPTYVQEIPDAIGTHAILAATDGKSLEMAEIFSWRLTPEGDIQAMLVNPSKVKTTPILLGDESLYPLQSEPSFKYYFQYRIANRIKNEDPDAIKAIALLMGH